MTDTTARATVPGAVDGDSRKLSTEGADLLMLAGVADANLAELQRIYPVRVTLRGDAMTLAGAADVVERAAAVAQHDRRGAPAPRRSTPTTCFASPSRAPVAGDGAPDRIVLPGVRKVIQPKSGPDAIPACAVRE